MTARCREATDSIASSSGREVDGNWSSCLVQEAKSVAAVRAIYRGVLFIVMRSIKIRH